MMHQITSVKESNVSSWTKAYMVPILLLLLLLTPAIVGVGVALVVVRAVLATMRAIVWTHKTKSVWQGLTFAPGLVYKCVRCAAEGAPAPRHQTRSLARSLSHECPATGKVSSGDHTRPSHRNLPPPPTRCFAQDRVRAEQVRVRPERLGPGALGQLLSAQLGRVCTPAHATRRV